MMEVKVKARSLVGTQNQFLVFGKTRNAHFCKGSWKNWQLRRKQHDWLSRSQKPFVVNSQMMMKPPVYTSKMATDVPLYEPPGASFDEYLENKPRVFEAIFPDNRRSQRISEEEWRIHMLPVQFMFATVRPVVDMRIRYKTNGEDYPPEVPRHISKVLELDITRWELRGLDSLLQPSDFTLGVRGVLYPDRHGLQTRLKGQLEMSISFVLPPMLALVPEDVIRNVTELLLKRLVQNMKHKVNGNLLADYGEFKKESTRKKLV